MDDDKELLGALPIKVSVFAYNLCEDVVSDIGTRRFGSTLSFTS
jgi:hypothetical protein